MSESGDDGGAATDGDYAPLIDDDPLQIQPPQRHAGAKHSSHRQRHRKRSTERKHKHRSRRDPSVDVDEQDRRQRRRRHQRNEEHGRSRRSRDEVHRSRKSNRPASPTSRHPAVASEVTSLMIESSHIGQRHHQRQVTATGSGSAGETSVRVDRHGNVYNSHRRVEMPSNDAHESTEHRRQWRQPPARSVSPQSSPPSLMHSAPFIGSGADGEVHQRRERCLQAVRESEQQKEALHRDHYARRQRRELRRQRDREIRRIEQKRRREQEADLQQHQARASDRKRRRQRDADDVIVSENEYDKGRAANSESALSGADSDKYDGGESTRYQRSADEKNVSSSEQDDPIEEDEDGEEERVEEDTKDEDDSVAKDVDTESVESSSASSSSSSSNISEQDDDDDNDDDVAIDRDDGPDGNDGADDEVLEDDEHRASAAASPSRRRWRTGSRSQSPASIGEDVRSPSPVGSAHSAGSPAAHRALESPEPSSPPLSPEERLPPYFPAIQGCRNVEEFNCLNRIEEGTYGVVYRAIDKRTKEIVALKRLKMENEKEGFPITSLREINTLLKAQHENIVTVREIVVGSNMDKIYIVMDYVEHDLKSLMQTMKEKKQTFVTGEVKCLMLQMLRAVRHLHDNWILHRDLKTSNLLLSHRGILKVGDFGLAREYGSPLKSYTPVVVTLWYRAPELLLGSKMYACPIDLWSIGCIFGELVRMEPMFPGKSEADQINRIFKELGTPNDKIWPGYSDLPAIRKMTFADYSYNQLANRFSGSLTERGLSLINKLLTYDPRRRITADEALAHNYFDEQPRPIDPSMFPTWPAKSEIPHRKSGNSPKAPSGRKNMGDDDVGFQLAGVSVAGGCGFNLKF